MKMYKFFLHIADEQPAYFLQVNPQNKEVDPNDTDIIEAAKLLNCHRIDLITPEMDYCDWWTYE